MTETKWWRWLIAHRNDFILPTLIFIFILVVGWLNTQSDNTRLQIACTSARANVEQLQGIKINNRLLRDIVESLGLPTPPRPNIVIPEVPPECEGI